MASRLAVPKKRFFANASLFTHRNLTIAILEGKEYWIDGHWLFQNGSQMLLAFLSMRVFAKNEPFLQNEAASRAIS